MEDIQMANSMSSVSSGPVTSTPPDASSVSKNSQSMNYEKLLKKFFDKNTSIDDTKFDKIRMQFVQQIQNNPKLLTDTPALFVIIDGLTTIHFYNFEHRIQREMFEGKMSLDFVTAYGTETISCDKDTPFGNEGPTAFSFVDLFNPDFCKKLYHSRGGNLHQQDKELINLKKFNVKDASVTPIILKLLAHQAPNPVEDNVSANNERLTGIPVNSTINNTGVSGTQP